MCSSFDNLEHIYMPTKLKSLGYIRSTICPSGKALVFVDLPSAFPADRAKVILRLVEGQHLGHSGKSYIGQYGLHGKSRRWDNALSNVIPLALFALTTSSSALVGLPR